MKIYYILVFTIMLISCTEKPNNCKREVIKTLGSIRLSPFVDSLFREYANEFPNAAAYVIFIDKNMDGGERYMVTIAPLKKRSVACMKVGQPIILC